MNMKKLILSFSLLFLSCFCSFSIDKDVARRVAQTVLGARYNQNVSFVSNSLFDTKSGEDSFSPFYVFNGDCGYVIVAGYEAAHPVLAYSNTGQFDYDMIPPAMKDLLLMMSDVIEEAKNISLKPSREVKAEWDHYLSGTKSTEMEVLLQTAKWNQGAPYNDLCPYDQGEHAPTGCANTATAIIMRYHKWPERGVGNLPDYESYVRGELIRFPGHALGHTYDWDSMPTEDLSSGSSYSDYQNRQVAQLMFDVGTLNRAAYCQSGTASGLNYQGLVAHFNYDPGIQKLTRGDCARDLEWERIIKSEIDSSRPVYYGVKLSSGGQHAVVIDGYRGRLFHINFGWGGTDDAFMVVSPVDGEASSIVREYRDCQHMIIGIQPNRNEETPSVNVVLLSPTDVWDYKNKEEFYMTAYVSSRELVSQNLFVAYGLIDEKGTIEEIISDTLEITVEGILEGEWWSEHQTGVVTGCVINGPMRSGHTIQLCQFMDEGWQVLPSSFDGVFHLGHGGQLLKESELEFIKAIPDDADWERVCFRVPSDAVIMIQAEDGSVLLHNYGRNYYYPDESSSDLRITKKYDSSGGIVGYLAVDKKRSFPPYTIQVTLSDLDEETTFSLTL